MAALSHVDEPIPILSKLDRLDNMLRQLEEIRGRSVRSSCESTQSSGTLTSDDDFSSSPKHCRPINMVVLETEVKGSLIDRLDRVEDRVLKMEEELVRSKEMSGQKKSKKGLKQLVKQCVKGGKYKA